MRVSFESNDVTVDQQKNRGFNQLRTDFSKAILSRFHAVKAVIEDVWDLPGTKAFLATRLKTVADKDPLEWTAKDLVDMALISCILWNGVDDEPV